MELVSEIPLGVLLWGCQFWGVENSLCGAVTIFNSVRTARGYKTHKTI